MSSNRKLSEEIESFGMEIENVSKMISAKQIEMKQDSRLLNQCEEFAVKEAIRLNCEYKKEIESLKQMLQ